MNHYQSRQEVKCQHLSSSIGCCRCTTFIKHRAVIVVEATIFTADLGPLGSCPLAITAVGSWPEKRLFVVSFSDDGRISGRHFECARAH